jgi:hypothetical protein
VSPQAQGARARRRSSFGGGASARGGGGFGVDVSSAAGAVGEDGLSPSSPDAGMAAMFAGSPGGASSAGGGGDGGGGFSTSIEAFSAHGDEAGEHAAEAQLAMQRLSPAELVVQLQKAQSYTNALLAELAHRQRASADV